MNMPGGMAVGMADPGSFSVNTRIQVSATKKPLFFYVNLAKKLLSINGQVDLSALGLATSTVVTVAEILKNNGLAETKRIQTSVVDVTLDNGRTVQKAKVEIALDKSANFDEIVNFKDDDAGAEKAATS
ncbi:hypothetical protein RI054_13g64200 [Pseudoscourfieldia marina]